MFDIPAGEARTVVRASVAAALAKPMGAPLLDAATSLVAEELTAREHLEVAAAWDRLVAHTTAGRLEAVVQLDRAMVSDREAAGGPGRTDSTRPAADELAPVLRVAPRTATELVLLARQVDADLPAAADALAEGRMSPSQLAVVAAVTKGLPATAARRGEALAYGWQPRRPRGGWRRRWWRRPTSPHLSTPRVRQSGGAPSPTSSCVLLRCPGAGA